MGGGTGGTYGMHFCFVLLLRGFSFKHGHGGGDTVGVALSLVGYPKAVVFKAAHDTRSCICFCFQSHTHTFFFSWTVFLWPILSETIRFRSLACSCKDAQISASRKTSLWGRRWIDEFGVKLKRGSFHGCLSFVAFRTLGARERRRWWRGGDWGGDVNSFQPDILCINGDAQPWDMDPVHPKPLNPGEINGPGAVSACSNPPTWQSFFWSAEC